VSGRIAYAIDTSQRFNRWGAHYLRALMRAYQLQLRTNNMDSHLQRYGGLLFEKLVKDGGKIFLSLKIDQTIITCNQSDQYGGSSNSCSNYISSNACRKSVFYVDSYCGGGSSGGCFASDSTVTLLQQRDHTHITTQIKNVRKHDIVRVIDGYAKVLCVVQIGMMSRNDKNVLVELNESGLKITPKHPIYFNDRWCLPVDLISEGKAADIVGCDAVVYNLVLDRCHVLLVNDIPCVTLGHGLMKNPITYDKFYATHHVIDFLNKFPGAEQGFVKVHGSLKKMWQLQQQKQDHMHQQMVVIPPPFVSSHC